MSTRHAASVRHIAQTNSRPGRYDPDMDTRPAYSSRTESLAPRTAAADRVVSSVCPYCAVGCGQLVYLKSGKIIDIEGDPRSPISEGCLCPKGAATFQLVTGLHRE